MSLRGKFSGLMIHPSLPIAEVKQKIRDEIGFTVSRLLHMITLSRMKRSFEKLISPLEYAFELQKVNRT